MVLRAGTGVVYAGGLFSSAGVMIVNVGAAEAKIETMLNSFVQLTPVGNQLQTENLLQGARIVS